MLKTSNSRIKFMILVVGAFVILVLLLVVSHSLRQNVRISYESLLAHSYSAPKELFPSTSTNGLSEKQQKIVALSKQEYNKKPVSFDANVLRYSQGVQEPWCANFVSWVMKESGVPYVNPNSGNWRIPGVNTLQEYFQSIDHYNKAGAYKPKVGDVAIYLNGRSHTNIVIAVNNNEMTTVGGNENGHIRVHTQQYQYGSEGLSGFGTF